MNLEQADALAAALMAAGGPQREALWQRAGSGDAMPLAWALKRRCDAAWTADPPATAVAAALVAALAERAPAPALDALAAWTRGIALLAQGQMEDALAPLGQAAEAYARLGLPHERAQTQVGRMMPLAMLGRYDAAAACGAEARAVFDAAGDSRAAGKVELNLGNLAAQRERHAAAAVHFREARERFVACADVELELMAATGLADMLARQHDLGPAEALYRQARERAERGGLALLTASIDGDLGALEMRRGRYDAALRSLERSRQGYAALDMPHYLAVAEESLADAYLELNLLPEALALYRRSLATYEAAGLATDRAWALLQQGRALALLGRASDAARSLDQAQQAFADDDNATGAALALLWRAELALQCGDAPAALERARAAQAPLHEARQLGAHLQSCCLIAEALRAAGDTAQAQQQADAAAGLADAALLPPMQRRARRLLGLLARDRGDAALARRCFESMVESIESQRGTLPSEEFRAAFLGDNLLPYHELVRLSLAEGGPQASARVLHGVERARARSLADAVASRASEAPDDDADAVRLRLRLDACYRELARPQGADDSGRRLDEARELEASLLEAGRRGTLTATPRPAAQPGTALDLPALHRALGDDGALVEYFAVDTSLHACVVAGGEVHVVALPQPLPALQRSLEQLRFQTDTLRHGAARLAHRLPELHVRALHHLQALHAGLWAPLLPRIGARRVAVVPHGILHYLPFEALHDGRLYEVERRAWCRAPSAALLLRGLTRPGPAPAGVRRALVLGHADARLPHVQHEVEAVAARLGGAQLLQGAAARADALQAAGAVDLLHIACHAVFRNDSPRYSALHLADGAFTVRDAARLELGGALVTLSACETGISTVLPGDELIGLTHAFLAAGASRVLASLWTVQDETAARLMQGYYEQLQRGAGPAQALRQAQLGLLQAQPHPYFWAAFTQHGGW